MKLKLSQWAAAKAMTEITRLLSYRTIVHVLSLVLKRINTVKDVNPYNHLFCFSKNCPFHIDVCHKSSYSNP
jgi:hypothetical protein